MTRPSPRKVGKARVWRAWAILTKRGALYDAFKERQPHFDLEPGERWVPVTIREVPPRKAGARRGK